jgi:hypothetical protein
VLPEYLGAISIRGLRMREGSVDLAILRHGNDTTIDVSRRDGDVEVLTIE